jgi:hypothetical protein
MQMIWRTSRINRVHISEAKKMEMSFSRKFLNAAGFLDYILGTLALIISVLISAAGVYVYMHPALAKEIPSDFGRFSVLVLGIAVAAGAVFTILYGYLERAAARDPARIMPVWVLSILSVVLEAGNIISDLVHHTAIADMGYAFLGLAFSILVLIITNNVRKEAGR